MAKRRHARGELIAWHKQLGIDHHEEQTIVGDVINHQFTAREYAVSGLASYRFGNGQVAHLNLGAARLKAQGIADTVGTWGLGYEFPLRENLQLTAETFGMEHSRPDKALGLRHEIIDGVKISGAIGRGNARNFGQVGVAWEFLKSRQKASTRRVKKAGARPTGMLAESAGASTLLQLLFHDLGLLD